MREVMPIELLISQVNYLILLTNNPTRVGMPRFYTTIMCVLGGGGDSAKLHGARGLDPQLTERLLAA